MPKVTLNNISNITGNPGSAAANINANFQAVSDQIDLLVSRDGEAVNTMVSAIDMNSNEILNLGRPTTSQSAARWADVLDGVDFTGIPAPSQSGNANLFLGTDGSTATWRGKWPARTAAEVAASVTPTNYDYPPGDVRRYGAVGDGTTDDTAAVHRWLSACNGDYIGTAARGKTYRCTAGLTISAAVQLECYGANFTFPFNGTAITVTASNVSIRGGRFVGNSAAYNAGGIGVLATGTLNAAAVFEAEEFVTTTAIGLRNGRREQGACILRSCRNAERVFEQRIDAGIVRIACRGGDSIDDGCHIRGVRRHGIVARSHGDGIAAVHKAWRISRPVGEGIGGGGRVSCDSHG